MWLAVAEQGCRGSLLQTELKTERDGLIERIKGCMKAQACTSVAPLV